MGELLLLFIVGGNDSYWCVGCWSLLIGYLLGLGLLGGILFLWLIWIFFVRWFRVGRCYYWYVVISVGIEWFVRDLVDFVVKFG